MLFENRKAPFPELSGKKQAFPKCLFGYFTKSNNGSPTAPNRAANSRFA